MPVRSDDEIELCKFGMVEFGDEHRGHAVQRRAFLPLDGLQRRQGIKTLAGIDHGGAAGDRSKIAHHHAKAMIERHRNADAVGLGEAHRAADEIAVVEDVVVRQRDALRRSRGAAGELDVDGIVELQGLGQCGEFVAVARAAHAGDLFERDGAGCGRAADLDHRAQLRQPRRMQFARRRRRQFRQQCVQHPHVVGGLERGRRDQRGAADFCQCEFEFAEAVGGIDGDENEAGLGGGKLRQRPFRPVQRPHPDAGAAFQPEREKARRQRIDPLGQFSPGPPTSWLGDTSASRSAQRRAA